MKKIFRSLALVLASAMLFTGCSGGNANTNTSSKSTSSTSESEPVAQEQELSGEITFWHSFTQGPRMETIQAAADAFMAEHSDVTINIETYSWADFYTKWTTGLASGNVPDMSTAQNAQVVEMIDADAIIPMDGLIDKIGRDRFYEAPLEEMTIDGTTYAIPMYLHAYVMWYRKDLLEKYNLSVPETWDELYTAAKTITDGENGEVYGCSVPMGTNDQYATVFLDVFAGSEKVSLLTEDRKSNLTDPIVKQGVEYWTKMYKDCSPSDSINYNTLDQATLYYLGKNAFDFNSGFHISGVETNTPDLLDYVDCAPIPTLKKGESPDYVVNNMPMVIWKNSKHPEICEAFMEYLYQPENYIPFLHSVPVGMLPALKEISDNPDFLNNDTIKKFEHAKSVIADGLHSGSAVGFDYGPCVEAGVLCNQRVVENMMQDIVLNGKSVDDAIAEADKKLNELISEVQ